MNAITWVVLIAYIPVALAIYGMLPPRQAFLWVVFGGYLFLPVAAMELPLVADYGKATAPSYVALLCTMVYHSDILLAYKPKWFDLPMAFWTVWQVVPSVANGYGLYDGLHQTANFAVSWALPYWLARCYFTRPEHLREVALAVVGCGLIYLPLCLFEIRMSPSLHFWIFGQYASPFYDMVRLGGYRPIVFMTHGLMLAFFMCAVALIVAWMWWYRREARLTHVGPVPIGCAAFGLVALALFLRSAGALMIFSLFAAVILMSRGGRYKWVLLVPVALMPSYIMARTMEWTDGRFMLDMTNMIFDEKHGRAGSLIARLAQEDIDVPMIRAQPLAGYGNWGDGRDQLWLLLARNTGLPTIACWLLTFSLPLVLCLMADLRKRRELLVFGVPLGLALAAWVMDGFFNGMYTPIWPVVAAAVMTAATSRSQGSLLNSTEFTESPVSYSMPETPQGNQPQGKQVTVSLTSRV